MVDATRAFAGRAAFEDDFTLVLVGRDAGAPRRPMSVALALALLLAVLIGLSLGTLGSGGSIITMPVLVYVADPAHAAVAMSLVVVGTTAAVGSSCCRAAGDSQAGRRDLRRDRRGRRLRGRQAHAPGAGDALMAIFAALMLLAGWRMLTPGATAAPPGRAACPAARAWRSRSAC